MRRILLPAVASTILLASATKAIGGSSSGSTKPRKKDDDDKFDMSSAIELARENIHRLIIAKDNNNNNNDNNNNSNSAKNVGLEGSNDEESESKLPNAQESVTTTTTTIELTNDQKDDLNLSYDGSDLIDWINDCEGGGYVHPDARIGLDPSGRYRGVFVKTSEEGGTGEGIEEGSVIADIPWDLIVKPKNYSDDRFFSCEAHFEMYRQFLLGDESPHAPYINYLKNQPRGRLINEWTTAGKRLLADILNHAHPFDEDEDGNGLPPRVFLKDYEEIWVKQCRGEDNELARAAFYQLTSRDEDTLMVPFYDMHNHSNDLKKLNTITSKPASKGKPFLMHSIKDIAPGEQILISYNRCHSGWADATYEDCASYSYYGTSQLFDIFGFVEDLPQLWSFRMDVGDGTRDDRMWDTLTFTLEASDDDDEDNDGIPFKVTFGDNYSKNRNDEYPVEENIKYLGDHLVRLRMLETTMKEDNELMQTIPRYEWDMAWRYHEALVTAMSAAILASDFAEDEDGDAFGSEGKVDSRGLDSDDDDDDDDSEDDSEDEDSRDEL